uniref:Si:rp71-68n21.9 n=1 Tax=Acanthochromis polyacanthus TaxID=80966 RepID=A0A3Q1G147_9TELE
EHLIKTSSLEALLERVGSGDDGGPGRLSRRLSRLGSRHQSRDPPRPPAQPERPAAIPRPPPPAPASPPAPAPLPPPTEMKPRRPDKATKPKLPPRPMSKVFSSTEHGAAVLQGFDSFRSDETLCDVVLVPGDSKDTFPVHRVLMASSSDYFKAMFTGGMREQEMREIKLHGVTKTGLKNIIDFIYTSKVSLDMGNLQDTLEAANFLQVMPVLSFCNQLLSSEITIDNCVEVEHIATDLLLEDVQLNIGEFVSQNLSELVDCGRYLQLSETTMANALSSNSLKGFSELELYHIARGWLDHDLPKRRSSVYALMRHIRFPLMSPSELIQISQDDEEGGDSMMRSETSCVNLLLEASNYQMMPFMQPALQTERTQIRSDTTHILALGGVMRQQLVVSRELRLYDEKTGHWRALRPMEAPRYQHGVALLGGFLFIVGGQILPMISVKKTLNLFFSQHVSAQERLTKNVLPSEVTVTSCGFRYNVFPQQTRQKVPYLLHITDNIMQKPSSRTCISLPVFKATVFVLHSKRCCTHLFKEFSQVYLTALSFKSNTTAS